MTPPARKNAKRPPKPAKDETPIDFLKSAPGPSATVSAPPPARESGDDWGEILRALPARSSPLGEAGGLASATVSGGPASLPTDSEPGRAAPSATVSAGPPSLPEDSAPASRASATVSAAPPSLPEDSGPASRASATISAPGSAPGPASRASATISAPGGGAAFDSGKGGPVAMASPMILGGGAEPDFLLRERIGAGGQGEVWRAWQTSLSREVAVKRLNKGGDAREFLIEAYTTAELDHPNIAPVHDLGRMASPSGREEPLLAMKLVRGTPWNELIKRERQAEGFALESFLARHLRTLSQVCNAVAYAHSKRVIHRDLKPHQVIAGEYGEVFLLDWGLAVGLDDAPRPQAPIAPGPGLRRHTLKTATNQAGSPAYMAPEQTRQRVDVLGVHTDIYLLGAILFELISGHPPHEGETAAEAFRNAEDNKLRKLPARVPPELAAAALKALDTDPAKRHASAEEFRDDLEDYLSGSGKRRESEEAAAEVAASMEERDAAHLDYSELARLRMKAERALQLWPGNPRAAELRDAILAIHARKALAAQDLLFARSLAESLPESNPDRRKLLARVKVERRREQRERRQRVAAIRGAIALLAILLAGGAFHYAERQRAYRSILDVNGRLAQERDRADDLRSLAEERRDEAERQKLEAERQRTEAQQQRAEAERQKLEAELQRTEAERQRDMAASARRSSEELVGFMVSDLRDRLKPVDPTLALLDDVAERALAHYSSQPLEGLGSDDWLQIAEGLRGVGQLLIEQGNTPMARDAFERAGEICERGAAAARENPYWSVLLARNLDSLGSVVRLQAGLDGALKLYARARDIRRELVERDPTVAFWQEELNASHIQIGRVHYMRGENELALEEFQAGLAAAESLAALDPGDPDARYGLARSREWVGYALQKLGELNAAMERIEAAGEIWRGLAKEYPGDEDYREALADNHLDIGLVFADLEVWSESLRHLRQAQAIMERLVASDPSNTGWLRQLGVYRSRAGNALEAMGDIEGALEEFREDLKIGLALVERDPENARWTLDYSISLSKMGRALRKAGQPEQALGRFREADARLRALVERDASNERAARWLRMNQESLGELLEETGGPEAALAESASLAEFQASLARASDEPASLMEAARSRFAVAEALEGAGKLPEALEQFRAAAKLRAQASAAEPENKEWLRELSFAHYRAAGVLEAMGDLPGALVERRADLEIAKALAEGGPESWRLARELGVSHMKTASVLYRLGDWPAAEEQYRAARDVRAALYATDESQIRWLWELSAAHHWLARSLREQGRHEEALAEFQADLAIARTIQERDPGPKRLRDIASSLEAAAETLLALERPQEALPLLREAEAIAGELADDDGALKRLRGLIAQCGEEAQE